MRIDLAFDSEGKMFADRLLLTYRARYLLIFFLLTLRERYLLIFSFQLTGQDIY